VTEEELEQRIEKARIDRDTRFYLQKQPISMLPNSICNLSNLTDLNLYCNSLTNLPTNIGNLSNLTSLEAMTSAEAAITWVNHGIHPDEFIVQT
jgi:Leucine-rich repeat (LRR) protein